MRFLVESGDHPDREQNSQKCNEVVRLWHGLTEFLQDQERFEELLGGLLAVEAPFIVKRFTAPSDFCGQCVVAFGFADPRPRGSFHTEPCPWS